jgi:hypothetical protein
MSWCRWRGLLLLDSEGFAYCRYGLFIVMNYMYYNLLIESIGLEDGGKT